MFFEPQHRMPAHFYGQGIDPYYYAADPYSAHALYARREAQRRMEEERMVARKDARRRAIAKERKYLLRLAHAAATSITAAYRGHVVRHHIKPMHALRMTKAQETRHETETSVASALADVEASLSRIFADHVAPAKITPTYKAAHVASELLMAQLLKLDGLDLPADADELRSKRRALVRHINQSIDHLDTLKATCADQAEISDSVVESDGTVASHAPNSGDEEIADATAGHDSTGCESSADEDHDEDEDTEMHEPMQSTPQLFDDDDVQQASDAIATAQKSILTASASNGASPLDTAASQHRKEVMHMSFHKNESMTDDIAQLKRRVCQLEEENAALRRSRLR
mmetsp:Transcript_14276/g.43381  ORF Transcript_14276/g.43381 Transcript_14276/m.43381 type:complete len:343 (-) Transcript_14276:167-1195(-)